MFYILDDGKVKPKVYSQIQMQMYFYEKEKGYLCIARPEFERTKALKSLIMKEVTLDIAFIELELARASNFWKSNVYSYLKDN